MIVDFILIVISFFAWWLARYFPNDWAGIFPSCLAWGIIVLAILDIFCEIFSKKNNRGKSVGSENIQEEYFGKNSLLLVVCIGIYLFIMPIFGFVFSSGILSTIALKLYGVSGYLRASAFGFGFSALIYAVFSGIMNVALPVGILN